MSHERTPVAGNISDGQGEGEPQQEPQWSGFDAAPPWYSSDESLICGDPSFGTATRLDDQWSSRGAADIDPLSNDPDCGGNSVLRSSDSSLLEGICDTDTAGVLSHPTLPLPGVVLYGCAFCIVWLC